MVAFFKNLISVGLSAGCLLVPFVVSLPVSQAQQTDSHLDQQLNLAVEQQCALENCWRESFPQIRQLVDGGAEIIDRYLQNFKSQREHAYQINPGEGGRDAAILEYRLELLRRFLAECEILRDGPQQQRHLIIIGHAFEGDGQNQRLAGLTIANDRRLEVCGPPQATIIYERCSRSVVVIEDTNKNDLVNFLRMLGTGSVQSLTYTGHGINNALVLGPKNLLLPVTWSDHLAISRDQWRQINTGMLYSRDVVALAPLLQRVMAETAPIQIYACDTGREFAPVVQSVLQRSTVQACLVPMHYEYQDSAGQWQTDWSHPVPTDALRTRLVPDEEGMFQNVNAAQPAQEALSPSPAPSAASQDEARHQATRDIVLRLAIGASRQAVLDQGRGMLLFSNAELSELRTLTSSVVQGRNISPEYNLGVMERDFEAALAQPDLTAERRAILVQLRQKLRDCINESVRLYYRAP